MRSEKIGHATSFQRLFDPYLIKPAPTGVPVTSFPLVCIQAVTALISQTLHPRNLRFSAPPRGVLNLEVIMIVGAAVVMLEVVMVIAGADAVFFLFFEVIPQIIYQKSNNSYTTSNKQYNKCTVHILNLR